MTYWPHLQFRKQNLSSKCSSWFFQPLELLGFSCIFLCGSICTVNFDSSIHNRYVLLLLCPFNEWTLSKICSKENPYLRLRVGGCPTPKLALGWKEKCVLEGCHFCCPGFNDWGPVAVFSGWTLYPISLWKSLGRLNLHFLFLHKQSFNRD